MTYQFSLKFRLNVTAVTGGKLALFVIRVSAAELRFQGG